MKNEKKYDIFISYRREGGVETAKHLRDLLTEKGYSVFFDTDSLSSGDFNQALFDVIEHCTDFIIILAPGALDRCVNEDDWVRQELSCALRNGKNIIPIMKEGFKFPKDLPEDIKDVRKQNGIKVHYEYFDAVVDTLISFLKSKPKKRKLLWLIPVAVLCCVAVAAVIFQPWKSKGSEPVSPEVQATAVQAESVQEQDDIAEHIWGNYIPEGTATILTSDGTQYTAVANSLVRKASGIEPLRAWPNLYSGYDNRSEENTYTAKDMIFFKDISTVSREDAVLKVTDRNGNTKDITLLTDASLLFIGIKDNGYPQEIKENKIVSIDFDWTKTPSVDIKYCRITQADGSFQAPVSMFWFLVNRNEGTGKPPSMALARDLSQYFDRDVNISDLDRIEITKNPTDAEYADSAEEYQTKMIIYLKNGDKLDLTVSKFFVFYAKAKDGLMHTLEKPRLYEITF